MCPPPARTPAFLLIRVGLTFPAIRTKGRSERRRNMENCSRYKTVFLSPSALCTNMEQRLQQQHLIVGDPKALLVAAKQPRGLALSHEIILCNRFNAGNIYSREVERGHQKAHLSQSFSQGHLVVAVELRLQILFWIFFLVCFLLVIFNFFYTCLCVCVCVFIYLFVCLFVCFKGAYA